MATQSYGDLTFAGRLQVELDDAEEPTYPDGFLITAHRTGHICFGTTRHPPQGLWIGAPTIQFIGKVAAAGTGNPGLWKIGVLQCISQATWTGHYTNGEQLRFRLGTDHGLLKDGGQGSLFFRQTRELRPASSSVYEAEIDDSDCPAVLLWREFSGDPFQPHDAGATGLGKLAQTEGEWRFTTFLAAVHQVAKVILTLAECHWVLTWAGTYDYDAAMWHAADVQTITTHHEVERARRYENPATLSDPLPFSLYLDDAKQNWEVGTPSGWVICRECRPNPAAADAPTFQRWGM